MAHKKLSDDELASELKAIYFSPGNAGIGASKLLAKLRKKGFSATLPRVQEWMRNQGSLGESEAAPPPDSYQRQRVYDVVKPNAVHEIDVLYLPIDPTGARYALTIVDLASRFKWAVPMQSKDAPAAAKALASVYRNNNNPLKWPQVVKVDDGSEFKGEFATMLERKGITIRRAKPADHRHQSMVESWNKQLAIRIFGEQRTHEERTGVIRRAWVGDLPAIRKEVNSEVNRLIHEAPAKAVKQKRVQGPPAPKVPLEKQQPILARGTPVRVLAQQPDDKGRFRATDPRWSREIYTVDDFRIAPDTPVQYQTSWDKDRWLLRAQLQPVKPGAKPSKRPVEAAEKAKRTANEAAAAAVQAGEKYIIERIVRPRTKKKAAAYEVKWKGYSARDNTIEPREQLLKDVGAMVREFEKKHSVVWKPNGTYTWKA